MAKLYLFNMITLDGFFEGVDHDITWHNVDEEFNRFAINQLNSTELILFGRITYELMANYWPTKQAKTDDPVVSGSMNTINKYVFSETLTKAEWANTTLVNKIAPQEIIKIKQNAVKDIAIFGSAELASTFIKEGLIDEFRIMVNPVVLGQGTPLFKNVKNSLNMRLVKTRTFNSGNVLLYYEQSKL